MPPLFHGYLGKVFALPIRDGQEHRHNKRRQQLQVVGGQAHAQHKVHDDVVDDGTDDGGRQLQCKVAEDLAEHDLTDDDRRQTDDDGTAAHVDVREALILRQQAARQRHKAVGDHQAQNDGHIGVDALRTSHVLVGTGRAQGAAKLCAEEPVQHADEERAEDKQHDNRIVECQRTDIPGRNQQTVLVHADGQVGLAAARACTP